jgi:hypothetical protein
MGLKDAEASVVTGHSDTHTMHAHRVKRSVEGCSYEAQATRIEEGADPS